MAETDPFIYSNIPASNAEAVSEQAVSYSTKVAKMALQGYFQRFFGGDFSPILRSIAPHLEANFTTDTLRAESHDKKQIQIARKMVQLHQKLPCILIMDTGSQIVTPGLGPYDRKDMVKGEIIYTKTRYYAIPMEIAVGHVNEDGANDLMTAVSLMLENANLIGHTISEDNWTLTFPLQHQTAQVSPQNVGDDPAQSFATGSISAEFRIEVAYYWKQTAISSVAMQGNPPGVPNAAAGRKVTYPATVRLNERPQMSVRGFPPGIRIFTTNPNVALITADRKIQPVRIGTCEIKLLDSERGIEETLPLTITM